MKHILNFLKRLGTLSLHTKSSIGIIVTVAVLLELISNLQLQFAHRSIEEGVMYHAESELYAKNLEIQKVMVGVDAAMSNTVCDVEALLAHPDALSTVLRRMVEHTPVIVGAGIMFSADYYPQKGHWFEPYVRELPDGTLEEDEIGSATHDYLSAEFYVNGIRAGKGRWSEPYYDDVGARMLLCTYTMPVRDSRGRTVALLGADISLSWLTGVVNARHLYPSSYNMVLSREGLLLVYPDTSLVMNTTIHELTANATDTTVQYVNRQMLSGRSGHVEMRGQNDEKKIVFYAPVDGDSGWSMAVVCSKHEVFAELRKNALYQFLLSLLGIALLGFIIYRTVCSVRSLQEANTAKERIESELRIARDIQMSMVPSLFPQRAGLDMFATMTPAKEVGGDLYGYLLVEDKLYFCVGDVSGKGVPASLCMAQAVRLFRTLAAQGMMPAEICTRMNDAMAEDNTTNMFMTFFLGLVDLATGHLHLCNAGHNPPVLAGAFLKTHCNVPIGIMSGFPYQGDEVDTIHDKPLFVYTDGLNEAEDPDHVQFGDDRLLDILRTAAQDARQVIQTLTAAVEAHRNGAEPNDDLTMLYLKLSAPIA